MDRCRFIYFVDRPSFGKRSCSVQFVNEDGGVMFKIYVGYNKDQTSRRTRSPGSRRLRERYRDSE